MRNSARKRCAWVNNDPVYQRYHDEEWGRPVRDAKKLFEFLILEGMQAGLSWITILKKRDNYRKAFYNFDAKKIARMTKARIDALMKNPGIIRNRLKITAIITNATAYLALEASGVDFTEFLWRYVQHRPIVNRWKYPSQVPTRTTLSDQLSKDLKKLGFKFVGTTICYAFMQAVGMEDAHLATCEVHA